MSRKYKIHDPAGIYFISFATVSWVDVFTRRLYKDILVDSLKYCQKEKGLVIHAWCIMSNHVHLVCASKTGDLTGTIRDLKRHTSKEITKAIENNQQESRKEWMLGIFKKAGTYNSNNKKYQFWRQDNKPIEVFTNEVIDQKINYIHNNPVVEGYVEQAEDYVYSSAKNYASEVGLIDVTLIM
ncbi:MAG: transposase [Flavobacteriales bacterium]|nr:MAG: transposase [Flavobacteriales bacterium]